jgi:Dolichyl-phosphate-mannose-protein mannosyltransferase
VLIRFAVGLACAATALVPIGIGAFELRRRFLPRWAAAPARLVESIVGLAALLGTAMALGTVGLFRLVPMTIALGAVGAAMWGVARRRPLPPSAASEPAPAPASSVASWVAVVATAAVTASWTVQSAAGLRGPTDTETLRYHLPIAARFVQEGAFTSIHYVDTDAGPLIAFYPHLNEVLHAIGMLFLGTDIASPVVNLLAAALVALAAWCIGRPFGAAPLALVGALLVLGTPQMVLGEGGKATSDMPGIAFLLGAVAVLVTADVTGRAVGRVPLVVAAVAAGLSAGTKFTFLPAVLALTVVVVVTAARGARVRRGLLWVGVVAVAGSFWYLRNLVAVGNPLPGVEISLGPITLPEVPSPIPSDSLLGELFDGTAWSDHFIPALRLTWGPAWSAIAALALGALVAGLIVGRRPMLRGIAFVGVVSVIGFVVSPQFLGPEGGDPINFVWNVRYVAHAAVLGLVLLPTLLPAGDRRATWLAAVYLVVLGVTQLDSALWPLELFSDRYAEPVTGGPVAAGLAVGALVLVAGAVLVTRPHLARTRWRPSPVLAGAGALAAVGASLAVVSLYEERRYLQERKDSRVLDWALTQEDARLAIVGLQLQYPYVGEDLSNHVQYVGLEDEDESFVPVVGCRAWRAALDRGDYTHVVVAPRLFELAVPPQRAWTEGDPAARLVLSDGFESVFELSGRLDPSGCPS